MRTAWRLFALSLVPPAPGTGKPAVPEGPDERADDQDQPSVARESRWVAGFAVARVREGDGTEVEDDPGEQPAPGWDGPADDVASTLDLATRNPDILRSAIGEVDALTTLAPTTKVRARALLSEALRQVESTEPES